MTTRIFVPLDAAALSVGAGPVAAAVRAEIAARKLDAKLVRNGSRGLLWLEPLLEIETPERRIGYGPVTAADVKSIFDAGPKADHPLKLGLVEAIPYLAKQQRLTFARCGITDPISMEDYEAHGGLTHLKSVIDIDMIVIHGSTNGIPAIRFDLLSRARPAVIFSRHLRQ